MKSHAWHVDDTLLRRYAGGDLEPSAEWSVEAHVATCEPCRGAAGQIAGEWYHDDLAASWVGVDRAVASPTSGPFARAVTSVGVPREVVRVLGATPSLTLAWIAAVAASLVALVVAAHVAPPPLTGDQSGRLLWFLLVAPVLPASGIVVAFGTASDPVAEIALAAPMRSGRSLLLRTAAVAAVGWPLTAIAAGLLPSAGLPPATWLLPSVAVTATAVAASAVLAPPRAVLAAMLAWAVPVGVVAWFASAPLVAFGPPTQATAAVAAATAGTVAVALRHRYEVAP